MLLTIKNPLCHFQCAGTMFNDRLCICYDSCQVDRECAGETLEVGLVKGNGYAITAIRQIHVEKDLRELVGTAVLFIVRLRNATGQKQWTGDWADT